MGIGESESESVCSTHLSLLPASWYCYLYRGVREVRVAGDITPLRPGRLR
jgi:hypothetical protein